MRVPVLLLVLTGLSACNSGAPDAASGPGFTDYNTYLDQRAAAAAGVAVAPAATTAAPTTFSTAAISGAIDAADGTTAGVAPGAPLNAMTGDAVLGATGVAVTTQPGPAPGQIIGDRPRGDAPANIQAESGEMAGYVDPTVSDEQDFEAVKASRTIADDAARIASNRAQYVVVQPGSLPVRPGASGPNIVEFALATTNPVGVSLYNRSSVALTSHDKACGKFTSPDQAQEAFLALGGPDRDRKNLDPDGDGFACSWDPTAFRTALRQ